MINRIGVEPFSETNLKFFQVLNQNIFFERNDLFFFYASFHRTILKNLQIYLKSNVLIVKLERKKN